MRIAYLIVLFLCSLGLAEDGWWQELFRAEDAASPPRAEPTDPLVVDDALDRGGDAYRGLLWMSVVSGDPYLDDMLAKERHLQEAHGDVIDALLMGFPMRRGETLSSDGWGRAG